MDALFKLQILQICICDLRAPLQIPLLILSEFKRIN